MEKGGKMDIEEENGKVIQPYYEDDYQSLEIGTIDLLGGQRTAHKKN